MSNQQKGLRSARAKPASTGTGKKRASSRKAIWQGTWVRILFAITVVALPLIAAGLAGPAIRGGSSWQGILQGMRQADRNPKNGNGAEGSGSEGSKPVVGGRTDFGQLSVKLFNPITRCSLRADFDLKGVAILEGGPKLEKIVKNKFRFIREQATVAIRNSSVAELTDPKLKRLQRRILIRINRSLDRPLLKSVDLDQFSLCEITPELNLMDENSDEEK